MECTITVGDTFSTCATKMAMCGKRAPEHPCISLHPGFGSMRSLEPDCDINKCPESFKLYVSKQGAKYCIIMNGNIYG